MYAKIVVCLDGSAPSLAGGKIGLSLTRALGSQLIATHIYDARLHSDRFREMEPVLPEQYQDEQTTSQLREAHKQLITEGFSALSLGYMEQFLIDAHSMGVEVRQTHREGRNYVELYRLVQEMSPDLLIMGAHGLGGVDNRIGSTAARLLRLVSCDVLIARNHLPNNPGIMVGIDGSQDALEGMRKALQWSKWLDGRVTLAAAYDPAFHTHVFRTMGQSLSPSRQMEIGLQKQEKLHDQIIDDGLGQLYQLFLDQAARRSESSGVKAETRLLQGKAYQALIDNTRQTAIDLMVVGRYGHHRESIVPIGSNSEAIAHLADANILVTASPFGEGDQDGRSIQADERQSLHWEESALQALQKVPSFAQPMARAAVEEKVRQKGNTRVTQADFKQVAEQFGMRPSDEHPSREGPSHG